MKKALSIFLSLVLIISTFGIMPFSANATDYQGETVLASSLQTGDTFEMGNYPQSRVTDEGLLTALENISCEMTSYGYMTNTRAATHTYDVVDMSYADFSYNGVFYRKVTINSYRPLSTGVDVEAVAENTYQDDNGYAADNSYYFKWEPIVWQVLDNEEDGVYVMSQKLLDSQALNNFYESVTWENSSLRVWLNSDFYNKAFSSNEKEKINTSTIVNENSPWNESISGGNNTDDNIFILSYNDSKNSSYGFSPEIEGSETRHAQGTDYAQSQGLRVDSENGNSWWLLRTRGSDNKQYTGVNNDGYTDRGYTVHHTDSGIRPAFKLAIDSELNGADAPNGLEAVCTEHNYVTVVTEPTCTAQGYTTYTCSVCGDSYVGDYTEALGHTPAAEVAENEVAASCTAHGSYEAVVYCAVCGTELSRETVETDFGNHTALEPVWENVVEATATENGSYESVVYCSECNAEVSRTEKTIPAGAVGDYTEGNCGNSLTYRLYSSTGVLFIFGSGDMYNYSSTSSPFYNNSAIRTVFIDDDVTSVGNYAFRGCTGITELTMPCSLKIYNSGNSFANCTNLQKLTLTKGTGTMQSYTDITSSATNTYYQYTPWYLSREKIKEIIIEDGITNIGAHAFRGITSSSFSVTIPNSVTIIGGSAFKDSTGLTEIEIPESVINLGSYAFYGCTGLTSIAIPSGITSISSYAFYGCTGLTSLVIPDNITSIKERAFYGCSSLTNVEIQNSEVGIYQYAFGNCSNLKEIKIPCSAKFYGNSTGNAPFAGATNIEKVTLTKGTSTMQSYTDITSSATNTYYQCTPWYISREKIKEIIIEDGITNIGAHAFRGITSSSFSVTIPNSVTIIGGSAFKDSTGLTEIEIPESVINLGSYAFYGCTGLTSIAIPSGITSISSYAFYGCTGLTSIAIPSGITSISNYAFYGCTGLTSLVIPDNITSVKESAFSGCSGLTNVEIQNSEVSIYQYAFKNCSNLKEIKIPCSAKFYGNSAAGSPFAGSTNIEKVTVTKGTGTMTGYTASVSSSTISDSYYQCTPWYINRESIKEIVIEDGVTNIGANAFRGITSSLFSITIPNSVTSFGGDAFYGCTGLTSIDIPSNVTNISSDAFAGCTGLTSIDIPRSVTSIGISAFYGCTGLISVVIPDSVTTIYNSAFNNCSTLSDVYYPGTESQWNNISIKSNNEPLLNATKHFEYVPVCEHSYEAVVTAPTCTAQGFTTYTCTACGTNYVDDYVDALGHTPAEAVRENEIAATCKTQGSYNEVVYCSVCHTKLSRETKTIDKLAHTPVTDEAVAPSCTDTGLTEGSHCSVCGEVIIAQEVVAALGHNYNVVVTAPTCTAQGYTTYTCTRCRDSFISDYVDAIGHTPAEAVIENRIEPTDTSEGSYDEVVYCSVCGVELSRQMIIVPALGHNYEAVVTAPTCTQQGYTTYICADCGYTYIDDYVDALGHTPAQAVRENEIPSTCTVQGSYDEVVYCSVCHTELSREAKTIDKLAHTVVVDAAVAANCTETGLTEGTHCSVCGEVIIAQEVVAALGHNYNVVVTKPNCTARGYTTYTCTICGDTYISDYVDALGHTPAQAVRENEIPSTCTVQGSYDEVVYCSVCHTELSREAKTIDKLAHTPVTDEAVAPTCTKTGLTEGSHCSVCNTVIAAQQTVNALGHNYSAIVTNPTCTAQGYTTYTCTRCNDSYISDYVNAKGHTPAEAVRENETPSTCSKKGSYDEVVYCTECHTELSREAKDIDMLPHTVVTDEAVAPTCTKTGLTEGSHCSVCNTVIAAQQTVNALGHNYSAVVTNPTCTAQGYTTYTCTRCNDSYISDYINAKGHTPAEAVRENEIPSTCSKKGSCDEVVYCSVCGEELLREAKDIDMLPHTAGEIVIENRVESTCVKKGSYDEVVYCTECNAELSRTTITLDLAEHSYRIDETVLPTCTSQGYTTYICSVCKDTYDDNFTDMISHKAGSAVRENEIPSTCSKKGSYDDVVYCTECHTELSRETKDIEMLAHTAITDEAVAATCTQTGLTEGSHCSVCGKVLVERQVTPMAEHTWDDGEVIQQATSTQEGIVKYTCTACHAVKTETIEKLAGKGKFVASNVSSKAGREISIEIYIEANPGITSLSIDVAYPEGLTLVSVTDEKLFGSGFSKGKLNSNPIALSWYKSDSSNDDSTGLFATLTFAIDEELPVGDYPIEITFDPDNIFDNEFNNVEFDVENGNVNIYSVIPGDIYQDDEINMKDIVLLQQYINRWDVEIDTEIADVNKDGKINMKDLVLIQQYINGWDVVLQ